MASRTRNANDEYADEHVSPGPRAGERTRHINQAFVKILHISGNPCDAWPQRHSTKNGRIADKSVTRIKRLRHIEPGDAPLRALRIEASLIGSVQTRGGNILGVPNASEREVLDPETCNNPPFASDLQRSLCASNSASRQS